jgi:hypothetical protein
MQPFWLDITCDPGNWDAVYSLDEEGSIRGAWAYRYGTRMGMQWIKLPVLTPFTAIWIGDAEERSLQKDIAHRHEVLADLERQLPHTQIFEIKFPWTFQDWLPLYWKGYRQETRYTFRFPVINEELIYENFSKSFRRNLRAAERHYTIEDGNAGDLYAMMERVFEMRDAPVLFSEQKLNEIIHALKEKNQCKIYAARDAEGVQATVLTVWDAQTSYYLIGGRRRTDSRHGINLLLWQAIRDAAQRGHAFDFEGSMIEGVNKFFQNFGAELTPYHYIYRYRGLAKVKYL